MAARAGLVLGGAAALGAAAVAVEDPSVAHCAAGAVAAASLAASPRRQPLAWIIGAGTVVLVAPLGPLPLAIALLAVAHAFGAGRFDTRWWGVAGLVALVAGLELNVLLEHDSAVPALFLPVAAWMAGFVLRQREMVAAQLADRVRELKEEREAHAALSVRYERARIASELHDIVAHAISVMVVQASAGQRLAARDPDATSETFHSIAGAARRAEEDLSRLVALLGDEQAIGPAPDLALVEELVARAAGSGLAVSLRLEGQREGFPAEAVELAYRVVQEGLTNALRYAAGAEVEVIVRGEPGRLYAAIENGPPRGTPALAGVGTGTGIQGLRERVDAFGGVLSAGATAAGGWSLSATLPGRIAPVPAP